jgi:RNA polymerase sigma-70 factor (ECF subfamily)
MPEGTPPTEIPWLEPYPDALLEGIADPAPGPDARFELHEAVQLAFVATIQHLPPRQRAVLLLRDVLGWSAAETAGLLDTSVASANSALQRARATLEKRFPSGQPAALPTPDDQQRELLDRYIRTWEEADLDGFVSLLRDDAILSMPPWPHWYRGREAIRTFFDWAWRSHGRMPYGPHQFSRLIPTAANRQPAFAVYRRDPETSEWRAHMILLLTLRGDAIASLIAFRDPHLFASFGLPVVLSPQDAVSTASRA